MTADDSPSSSEPSTFSMGRVAGSVRPVRFRLSGELDISNARRIHAPLADVADDVVLDLRDVPFIDSSGIGALLAERARFEAIGHHLRLEQLQGNVAHSLQVLGVHDHLTEPLQPPPGTRT